jgi:hypothetical protein
VIGSNNLKSEMYVGATPSIKIVLSVTGALILVVLKEIDLKTN